LNWGFIVLAVLAKGAITEFVCGTSTRLGLVIGSKKLTRKQKVCFFDEPKKMEEHEQERQDPNKWPAREINVPADEWAGPPGPRNLPQEPLGIETAFRLLFDEEIWQHLAVLLAMGISPESEIREYWSETDPWVGNQGIANTCSRDDFRRWHKIFHFEIDWLVERCIVNSKAHWSPHKKMAVDEWLQAWKGTCLRTL